MANKGTVEGPIQLITTPQDVTADWVDVGPEIPASGFNSIGFWLEFGITGTTSLNLQFRLLLRHTKAGTAYNRTFYTASTGFDLAVPYFVQLDQDADQNLFVPFDLNCAVPFVQLQIMAGSVGATPASLDNARYTLGMR